MSEKLLVSLLFIAVGAAIAFVPARYILNFDRRTGYWFYQRTLRTTNDEERAVRSAGLFYKAFGAVFAFIGLTVAWMEIFTK